MTASRHLAAIMFADIMSFTAIMQDDETRALALREKLKKKLISECGLHGGRIIKFSGDGALLSFESASESVRAAIAVQLEMKQEPRVPVRIGIHQADVVFEENDVHGDGVNIASRLESIAVPGSIFVSAKVYDDIKNQKDIQTVSLGKYALKNVHEPVEIFVISNPGLEVPLNKVLEGKAVKYKEKVSGRKRVRNIMKAALPVVLLLAAAVIFIPPIVKRANARNKLLPAIQQMVNDNFRPPVEAFDMALEAEKYIPKDSSLDKLWPSIAWTFSLESQPSGAELYWKDYHDSTDNWRLAGTTPLKNILIPRSFLRLELRKKGYQTVTYAGPNSLSPLDREIKNLKMDPEGTLPKNMVRIPGRMAMMFIVGLEQHGGKFVGEFLVDKYEVTNAQYREFMNAGGYNNKAYWKFPILSNGKEISFEAAAALFRDKTGRLGPSTWEAGSFPNGMDNHPVVGVSWYEAMAYAAFAGKSLPTVFHWSIITATSRSEYICPLSNINGSGTVAVGSKRGLSTYGIYDLAGNAREWCANFSGNENMHYILGGGWNDPAYSFNDAYMQDAMDRSVTNGFRCMKEIPGDTTIAELARPVTLAFRDYTKEKPVNAEAFELIQRQFNYDKTPLEAKIESTLEDESWRMEKISFRTGYGKERMDAYLYLPKDMSPPYQPIVYIGGSGDIFSKKFNPASVNNWVDFIMKSGRALMIPILKGTHERHDELKSDLQDESVFYKDHLIMWRKDVSRAIDYLETRKDIQPDNIGYLGWSWGGFLGGIIPALENRIKAIVLNVGGMGMTNSLPEVDQLNFLPRVKQPVLMLNGKYDMFFPVETSQKPMFNFLGTSADKKKLIIYESGHLVPRVEFVKETLLWYDKYLGEVKK